MRSKSAHPVGWPPEAQGSDLDLLSRIKRREPEALGQLYDRCGKLAYAIIVRIVPAEDVAEDLLAETFVTVWNQIARWRDTRVEDLRLWVLLLARDHAIEYLRSRNEPLPKALPRPNALTQPSVLQDFPRPRNVEHGQRLRSAFSTLTEKESRTMEMACFDGMSPAEIAVTVGEPVASVKDCINAALRKVSSVQPILNLPNQQK